MKQPMRILCINIFWGYYIDTKIYLKFFTYVINHNETWNSNEITLKKKNGKNFGKLNNYSLTRI